MSGPSLKLPRGADEWLRELPLREPDFEAQAQAIEARLALVHASADPLDVLAMPALVPEPGEPQAPPEVRPAAAPPRSFTAIARRSLQQSKDDRTALVKELLAATSHARRADPELVARVRAAGNGAATSTPLPSGATPLPSGERPSGVVARLGAVAAAPTPSAAPPRRRGLVLGALGGALALAASVALFVKLGGNEAASSSTPVARPALAEAPETRAEPAAAPATPTSEAADESPVLTPGALAEAPAERAKPSNVEASAPKAASGKALAVAPAPRVTPEPSAPAAPETKVASAPSAAAQAEPPPEPQMKPAQGSHDSLPLSPSGGAVSTALAAVRNDAQACLAGQTSPVVAVVTFASDGHVTSVTAGGPSGACIQAALAKARLSPFARDQFRATTTIRPP